jgi:HEAT repeat protein
MTTTEIDDLIKKLQNDEVDERFEAALTLGSKKDKKVIEALICAFEDGNPEVRLQAAKSLSKIGDMAVEPLIESLKIDDSGIRRYATYSLKGIGDSSVIKHLIDALKDDDWGVRKFSAKSLGEMEALESVESLIETLEDDDWGVRVAATKALGDIGDGRAVDPIKKARRKARGDKEYKKVANKVLKKI